MGYRVTFIPGDGIGPEVAWAARRCLDATPWDSGTPRISTAPPHRAQSIPSESTTSSSMRKAGFTHYRGWLLNNSALWIGGLHTESFPLLLKFLPTDLGRASK